MRQDIDVAVRDGLQTHAAWMATERKLAWIAAAAVAGLPAGPRRSSSPGSSAGW